VAVQGPSKGDAVGEEIDNEGTQTWGVTLERELLLMIVDNGGAWALAKELRTRADHDMKFKS
jgi:hypothetical protein